MKITLQNSISKRIWDIHCWAIRAPTSSHGRDRAPDASFFFGVRIMLGTILGRLSIIYFRGLGLRIRVRVWVSVSVMVRVMVSVVLWSG